MTDDMDQIDTAADQLGAAADSAGTNARRYAYGYLTVLFLAVIGAAVAAVHFGYVTPSVTVSASVSVGWIIEYVVMFFAAVFALWTAAMILVALPGSFVEGTVSAIARIADAYELPDQ